jgi:hypothetical protein
MLVGPDNQDLHRGGMHASPNRRHCVGYEEEKGVIFSSTVF